MNEMAIQWLLDGDVSIRYQVFRDLFDAKDTILQSRIANEGWGKTILEKRGQNGHWGSGFYQPKWTSTHYTLLELKNLAISSSIPEIGETINLILRNEKSTDGGVNPGGGTRHSDVCINGMFLNYASYFNAPEDQLRSVIDFLIGQQMPDGGFNCHSNRIGASHSSLHTTLSVLEGICQYKQSAYSYRMNE